MLFTTSRAVVRHRRGLLNRPTTRRQSTTSQATQAASTGASKAADAASSATSKASEGLSRVSSSAGSALSGVARGAGNTLSRIGGPAGRLVSFTESMIPPTIYYSRVGFELVKLVFQGQRMSPPSVSTFQSHMQPLLHAVRRPTDVFSSSSSAASALNPVHALGRVRRVNGQELAAAAVVTAEVIGFFTVGEMLGRFKIIGYRGETSEHH